MHSANRKFWAHTFKKYARWFTDRTCILEVGSLNENGSLREHVPAYHNYTGLDWRPGPGVDWVVEAKNIKLRNTFNAVISASMLEHDAEPELSIPAMCEAVDETGILILSWGAALNPPHYHALPAGRVLDLVEAQKFYIHEFHYEYLLPYLDDADRQGLDRGCVGLVALRNQSQAPGPRLLDPLLPEDIICDRCFRQFESHKDYSGACAACGKYHCIVTDEELWACRWGVPESPFRHAPPEEAGAGG